MHWSIRMADSAYCWAACRGWTRRKWLSSAPETTHSEPTFVVDEVVHYCVANMPGGVPRTSTFALNNATLPHVLTIADLGYKEALGRDPHLRNGLNIWQGHVTCENVAGALGCDCLPAEDALRRA